MSTTFKRFGMNGKCRQADPEFRKQIRDL